MRAAADCNNIKACFPVAVIYFVVDGMTWGVSYDFWIQMCVRELAGCKINPLTALEFVSFCFVSEMIATFSGSFWTQLAVKKFA